jgi:hypothetical protein
MSRRLLLLLLLLFAPLLHAQASLAVYGTIGTENSGLDSEGWSKAGTIGLYHDFSSHGPVSLAVDARLDLSTNVNSGLIGPRLALHFPVLPIKPYAELLVGGTYYRTATRTSKDSSDLAYRWVGGIDTAILPHLDWRILDFSYGGGLTVLNKTIHMKTLSTGLVLRF